MREHTDCNVSCVLHEVWKEGGGKKDDKHEKGDDGKWEQDCSKLFKEEQSKWAKPSSADVVI